MRKRTDNKGRKLEDGESQQKDGRYQFRYVDNKGHRKLLYSWRLTTQDKVPTGKKDDKCLRELELEILQNTITFVRKTVSQCVREFLTMRTDYATGSIALYEKISTYAVEFFNNKRNFRYTDLKVYSQKL